MRLVPNWPKVLALASSMWAVYGGMVILLIDKAPQWLKGPQAEKLFSPEWRDVLLGLCLLAAPVLRIIQQRSLQPPAIQPMSTKKE